MKLLKKNSVMIMLICLICNNVYYTGQAFTERVITITKCSIDEGVVKISGEVSGVEKGKTVCLLIMKSDVELENIKKEEVIYCDQTKVDINSNLKAVFNFSCPIQDNTTTGTYKAVVSGLGLQKVERIFGSDTIKKYYVSTTGNNANNGTSIDTPFLTIEKARDTIRTYKQDNGGLLPMDVEVYLRGGNYFVPTTISFNENDSGNNGYTISYRNYPGEMPVLIASTGFVSNWVRQGTSEVYRASIPVGKKIHTMYENGQRAVPARYPDTGYKSAATKPTGGSYSKSMFYYRSGDIPSNTSITDLEAVIWAGDEGGDHYWIESILKVGAISDTSVSLGGNADMVIGGGSRYYVQDAPELLNVSGEFYCNSSLGYVDYIPYHSAITESKIIIPSAQDVFKFTTTSETNPVKNIKLKGLEIWGTDRGASAIYLGNAAYITVDACKLHDVGYMGIEASGAMHDCTFSSNEIFNTGESGIGTVLYGYYKAEKLEDIKNGRCEIVNNHIYNVGQLYGQASCIHIKNSGGNHIANNLLHDSRRYAIDLIASNVPSALIGTTVSGVVLTAENVRQYTHTQDNIVEYNDIYRCLTDSQDAAPIYTWGSDAGNIIQYNAVHDSNFPYTLDCGIYLDDESDYHTIKGNLIYNHNVNGTAKFKTPLFIKGIGNIVEDNIIANNKFDYTNYNVANIVIGSDTKDKTFNHNIVYNSGKNIMNIGFYNYYGLGSCNNNIYYDKAFGTTESSYIMAYGNGTRMIYDSLPAFRTNKGLEMNTICADPGFMDPNKSDFRLKSNSPAYTKGMGDLNLQNIGLRSDFPYVYGAGSQTPAKLFVKKSGQNVNSGSISVKAGENINLELMARSQTGYVCDISGALKNFTTADSSIVTVNTDGTLTALKCGITTITATVQGVSTDLQVVVDDDEFTLFKNSMGDVVENLDGLNELDIRVHLTQASTDGEPVIAVVARYSPENKLLSITTKPLEAGVYDAAINITNIPAATGSKIKVYVWKNMNSMIPVMKIPGSIIHN